jgi:hypothetical protein
VADPDQIASGVAGTGQENRNKTGITGKPEANIPQKNCRKNREIIGLGVLYNGPMNAGRIPDTGQSAGKYVPEDPPEGHGDLIFSLYERQERIADRLNKKIARLDRRLIKIERRGRSQ